MALIFDQKNRNVIPNWRDFKRTIQMGELAHSAKHHSRDIPFDITRSLQDWRERKNIGTAADLLNSAFVSGITKFKEIIEAVQFVIVNEKLSSKSLIQIANLLKVESNKTSELARANSILEMHLDSIDELETLIDTRLFFKIINKTRNKTRAELLNPINWIELARLYSIRGQKDKGERAILIALQLAPNNRFVLRSSTRFFVHSNQPEKALYYLRKATVTQTDPWLISAHIATSTSITRFSPFLKTGNSIIESKNFSDFDLTELTSSIGTVQFKEGSIKKAKNLFTQAMKAPNDNSLAQLEWVSRNDNSFNINPFSFRNVINPFEAYAFDHFLNGNWNEAFANCIKWFTDTPFSQQPLALASYIAVCLSNDSELSIRLCELGLKANPNDPTLLNNIVFSYAISNQIDRGRKYVHQLTNINFDSLENEQKIMIQATLGLLSIRTGEIDGGKKAYERAIQNAKNIKSEYYTNLAIVNYTRELILLKDRSKKEYIELVLNMHVHDRHKDLIEQRKSLIEMIKSDTF